MMGGEMKLRYGWENWRERRKIRVREREREREREINTSLTLPRLSLPS